MESQWGKILVLLGIFCFFPYMSAQTSVPTNVSRALDIWNIVSKIIKDIINIIDQIISPPTTAPPTVTYTTVTKATNPPSSTGTENSTVLTSKTSLQSTTETPTTFSTEHSTATVLTSETSTQSTAETPTTLSTEHSNTTALTSETSNWSTTKIPTTLSTEHSTTTVITPKTSTQSTTTLSTEHSITTVITPKISTQSTSKITTTLPTEQSTTTALTSETSTQSTTETPTTLSTEHSTTTVITPKTSIQSTTKIPTNLSTEHSTATEITLKTSTQSTTEIPRSSFTEHSSKTALTSDTSTSQSTKSGPTSNTITQSSTMSSINQSTKTSTWSTTAPSTSSPTNTKPSTEPTTYQPTTSKSSVQTTTPIPVNTTTKIPTTSATWPVGSCLNGGYYKENRCVCISEIFYGPNCEFIVSEIKKKTVIVKVTVEVYINETFYPDLENNKSSKYQLYKNNFLNQMTKIYEKLNRPSTIHLSFFREGSVVVNHEVSAEVPFLNSEEEKTALVNNVINVLKASEYHLCPYNTSLTNENFCYGLLGVNKTETDLLELCFPADIDPELIKYYYTINATTELYCVNNCSSLMMYEYQVDCHHGQCSLTNQGPMCYCNPSDQYWYTGDRCQTGISKAGVIAGVTVSLVVLLIIIVILVYFSYRRQHRTDRVRLIKPELLSSKWNGHERNPNGMTRNDNHS
ncbi:mucin-3A-like isoform X2 [Rana temporaria]|uniref:mucin-3A-like isoform X2 n=1 Tax=Rana temporaria TaxID=8407 RepID=UPI001AACFA7F|nr:mucin-3A-like isoform X2 [Rana temporaria]